MLFLQMRERRTRRRFGGACIHCVEFSQKFELRHRSAGVVEYRRLRVQKYRRNYRVRWIRDDNPVLWHSFDRRAERLLESGQGRKKIGVVEFDIRDNEDFG